MFIFLSFFPNFPPPFPMNPHTHNRRLQVPIFDDAPFQSPTTTGPQTRNSAATATAATLSPPPLKRHFEQNQQYTSQSFESGMVLTVLILLIALFFMGFFSIYIRRFTADSSTADFLSSRPPTTSGHPSRVVSSRKGLDPEIVRSLPVYAYCHGDVKYQMECAICLGEFEERDCVKLIPYCQHVFHLECIDAWLKMHSTCPVCRGTLFFEVGGGGGGWGAVQVQEQGRVDQGVTELEGRSTVESGDTLIGVREVGTVSVRRTNSCSSLGGRMQIQRTSSL